MIKGGSEGGKKGGRREYGSAGFTANCRLWPLLMFLDAFIHINIYIFVVSETTITVGVIFLVIVVAVAAVVVVVVSLISAITTVVDADGVISASIFKLKFVQKKRLYSELFFESSLLPYQLFQKEAIYVIYGVPLMFQFY